MMQAFANRQAVKHTLKTGKVRVAARGRSRLRFAAYDARAAARAAQATFWTRSRQQLWTKGETSECVRRPRRAGGSADP